MNSWLTAEFLVATNKKLIEATALRNCHCLGLNSFIINENPRIRLFIADQGCELFQPFDNANPLIPIHPHKYSDLFATLMGEVTHHLYKVEDEFTEQRLVGFRQYTYNRISDQKSEIVCLGNVILSHLVSSSAITQLNAEVLHTVSLTPDSVTGVCAWMIMETYEDPGFKQVSYHQYLEARPNLYQAFPDAYRYLQRFFGLTN